MSTSVEIGCEHMRDGRTCAECAGIKTIEWTAQPFKHKDCIPVMTPFGPGLIPPKGA